MLRLGKFFALFAVASCTHTPPTEEAVKAPPKPPIQIIMTVDWEGRDLDPANLQAMAAFRHDYPDLPILHYLNAAYYTKPKADPVAVTKAINSVLLPHDQLGLHIHGWRSLFQASGVKFRREPNLDNKPLSKKDCAVDCGHAVAISGYTEQEADKVIAFSIQTLDSHGFGKARHFRAGAWMLSPALASALAHDGFVTDSSALPTQFLIGSKWEKKPLYKMTKALWPQINELSQPYQMITPGGPLEEVPDNGCLADYMPAAKIMGVIKANLVKAQTDKTTRYVVIGFHQETATKYINNIRQALDELKKLNAKERLTEFVAMPDGQQAVDAPAAPAIQPTPETPAPAAAPTEEGMPEY